MNNKKGFTLIELLVVIAIIGIISAIVLVALGAARKKGNDAKMQGQLSEIRKAAETYGLNNSNSFSGLCQVTSTDKTGMYKLLQASNYSVNIPPNCQSSVGSWAAQQRLETDATKYFCVDSLGQAMITTGSTISPAPNFDAKCGPGA